jgi:hypothetical protein
MAAALVQASVQGVITTTTSTVLMVDPITAGDTLIAACFTGGPSISGHGFTSITGGGVSWSCIQRAYDNTGGDFGVELWAGFGSIGESAGSTIVGVGGDGGGIRVTEWSGVASLDDVAFTNNQFTPALSTPVTPTRVGDLFVVVTGAEGGCPVLSGGSPYTSLAVSTSGPPGGSDGTCGIFAYYQASDSLAHQASYTNPGLDACISACFEVPVSTGGWGASDWATDWQLVE